MPSLPLWVQWLIFAAVSLVSMVFFRKRVYRKLRPAIVTMQDDLTGELVQVPQDVAPGDSCRMDYRGSTWTARNDGSRTIAAGTRARIVGTQGITLRIESAD